MITDGLATRKMCSGPPKQGHAEKKKKKAVDYVTVLKANPYRIKGGIHGGEFTSKARAGAPGGTEPKDVMRIENLLAKGPKSIAHAQSMAKSITTWEKAHRRANAAEAAAKQPHRGVFEALNATEMAKVFRARADAIREGQIAKTTAVAQQMTAKPTPAAHTQELQQAASHVHGTPDGGTKPKGTGSAFEKYMQAAAATLKATPKAVAGSVPITLKATPQVVAGVKPVNVATTTVPKSFYDPHTYSGEKKMMTTSVVPSPTGKTHKTWVTGMPSSDSGGVLSTANPEKNWLVMENGGKGVVRLERHGKPPILVSGGSDAKAGDQMDIFDDGNGATGFGSKTGTRYTVTHTANSIDEIKALPKGRHRFYVMK